MIAIKLMTALGGHESALACTARPQERCDGGSPVQGGSYEHAGVRRLRLYELDPGKPVWGRRRQACPVAEYRMQQFAGFLETKTLILRDQSLITRLNRGLSPQAGREGLRTYPRVIGRQSVVAHPKVTLSRGAQVAREGASEAASA